jgi:hypothetical protein
MNGYTLRCEDGEIGRAVDFYLEEREWFIRFVVCDARESFGRYVLIPPQALESPADTCGRTLRLCTTRSTIKNSPPVRTDRPVTRAQQHILDRYYTWHLQTPGDLIESLFSDPAAEPVMHSARELLSYHLHNDEGELAGVEDFIIDDDKWDIDYLVLQAGLWLPGKRFLLDPRWIEEVGVRDKRLYTELPSEKVRRSPDYDPSEVITPALERAVQENSGPPRYSSKTALEEIIRRKAQELFQNRGGSPGNDWADWFEAERQVKEELNRLIKQKARELCNRRGCKPGEEWNDWFEAERIVQQQIRKKAS